MPCNPPGGPQELVHRVEAYLSMRSSMKYTSPTLADVVWVIVALSSWAVVFPPPAHAYIDPVSGSIILQVLAAGALAAAFTFKRSVHRVRELARSVWTRLWSL